MQQGKGIAVRCIFHKWGKYEAPKQVTEGNMTAATVGQRRVCTKCGAVDYRRVLVHN
jgi:hypothetical protein